MLHFAQHCQLPELEDPCLGLPENKLAAAVGHWGAVSQGEEALAALDSRTLARLLGKTLQSVEDGLPKCQHVFDVRDGSAGSTGGFMFAIPAFSKQPAGGRLESPWVDIGGFQWRLRLFSGGKGDGVGTHLSGK